MNSESFFIKKGNVFVINEKSFHAYMIPLISDMLTHPAIYLLQELE